MNSDEIRLAHVIDDAEKQRTAALRASVAATALLTDGLHALRAGRSHITDEFVERAIAILNSQTSCLSRKDTP